MFNITRGHDVQHKNRFFQHKRSWVKICHRNYQDVSTYHMMSCAKLFRDLLDVRQRSNYIESWIWKNPRTCMTRMLRETVLELRLAGIPFDLHGASKELIYVCRGWGCRIFHGENPRSVDTLYKEQNMHEKFATKYGKSPIKKYYTTVNIPSELSGWAPTQLKIEKLGVSQGLLVVGYQDAATILNLKQLH